MTSIEQLIGDLLLRHNCVIVPKFGGFVAQQVSAKIDFEKGTMSPPSKALLFNRQLVTNDGLLINEHAIQNACAYEDSKSSIDQLVNDWEREMKAGGRIELERIGILYLDQEKNVCFEQDRFCNLLLASFGLEQVQFLTDHDVKIVQKETLTRDFIIEEAPKVEEVKVHKPAPAVAIKTEPKQIENKEEKVIELVHQEERVVPIEPKKPRRYWKYAAAAIMVPIAFYSVWIPVKTDVLESGMISIHDFNPFHEHHSGKYAKDADREYALEKEETKTLQDQVDEVETDEDVLMYEFGPATYIPVHIEKQKVEEIQLDADEESSPEPVQLNKDISVNSMHLIVGCFGNQDNAHNLVSKLKSAGFDAKIVDVHGGLHRVSAGSSVSNEGMTQLRSQASVQGFEGWILK